MTMPDFDPKSIPILDDIIEDEKTEPELTHTEISDAQPDTAEAEPVENNLDLFNSDAVDIDTEIAEPAIGTIDQFIDSAHDQETMVDEDTTESALIDYPTDEDVEAATPQLQQAIAQDETQSIEDTPPVTTSEPPPHTGALTEVVDDVVRQLLPDLEQQLRFLVLQALEEKLPDELIKQLTPDPED